MSDQTTPRPDSQGPGAKIPDGAPGGYEPPQFVPAQESANPVPPPYGWNQPAAGQYDQPAAGQYDQPAAGQYDQPYGAPYQQPGSPYGPQGTYGQPAPFGQPAPYGQPAYYGMPAAEPRGLSITSLVCGISSVILGWFLIPQVAAIITGHLALGREPSGKGMSIAGLVLGYVCLLGYGALWVLLIIGMTAYSSSYGY